MSTAAATLRRLIGVFSDSQPPADKLVQLVFEGFEFHPRAHKPGSVVHMKCVDEAVEIRLGDQFTGDFYCGNDIKEGSVMTSASAYAAILIYADDATALGKGLRVKVRFVDAAGTHQAKNKTSQRQSNIAPPNAAASHSNRTGVIPLDIIANIFTLIGTLRIG